MAPCHLQPLGDVVDAEDLVGALVAGDAGAHLPDRAEAEDGDAAAVGDRRVVDRLPGGRQHVGEEEIALVGSLLGNFDRPEMGLRHPQELRLATRHLAVELGVAEQRGAFFGGVVLGRLALGVVLALAHPAGAAGDVEGDHDAVARFDLGDRGPDLLDDAHRLVAEDVALVDEHPQHLVKVEV
jgi:hypothetical protein